ncbi:NADPH dehydrogenase NamA [Terrilactibacillus sp. BCM23-1]|uniref:NADPH dehydrogenase n=1 Tax=Terrilactibacillus tamarindi TaxID=2599694 RepID=A0A6N8CWW9_9BACI|nr:NADPH dehydrogenase NamA [Terrilactibacillus tamarindi]MTT33306.1 NADPH dehydrogenase NamA [Terrilactibacillus tamarindi]
MQSKLFTPYKIKDVTLKNRIVMAPMCMYSSDENGHVNDWHLTHYTSRAIGQVGLIIIEATAVNPKGRISASDLGIWSDEHIEGLKKLTTLNHKYQSKIGIQLAHAGRKAQLKTQPLAPSAIPFNEEYQTPHELSIEEIKQTIYDFKQAARRAKEANFDVIEIHAAHGYLIHEFLSPLSNQRKDQYGGSEENRYRLLHEVIEGVKEEWSGPLFVRISANDFTEGGNTPDTYVPYAEKMKAQGVDLIDVSSGALVPAQIDAFPGYQVPYADQIKNEAGVATGAVGLITHAFQAEEILKNNRADLIFIARELLRDPYWPKTAAITLGETIDTPVQYERGWRFK